MEAIILAGGMGTRLKKVVSNVPKPMAPIGDKPFLEILLEWISLYSISRIVLSIGYKAEIIEGYFGKSFNNIPLVYAKEHIPLGTGGAIINSLNNYTTTTDVLIINGDTYFPIDINHFYKFHLQNFSKISVALKQMENFDRYGTVVLNKDSISMFNEKQYCDKGIINGGIYILNKGMMMQKKFPEKFSFEKEILEPEASNDNLRGMIFNEPFIDIGIPEDYQKAREIL